jgi:LysR family transcriptional activator of nhaA
MIRPTENSALRRALDQWFQHEGLRPRIVADLEDRALMKVFAQHGAGLCAAPTIAAAQGT